MADSPFEKSLTELAKMKVADLKAELKQRGLPTTGNKTELQERLQLAIQDSSLSLDEATDEILNEDAILGDEEIETEELNAKPDSLSINVSPQKRKLPASENNGPAKKVTLVRKLKSEEKVEGTAKKEDKQLKIDKPLDEPPKKLVKLTESNNEAKPNEEKSENKESEKKIIKFSELSNVERLEMRAKKFGVPLSESAKKEARAARFNINASNNNKSAASIKSAAVPASYEILKKRAERFGTNVSSLLEKAELEAKKEQRKARFGEIKAIGKETSKVKLVK